MNQNYNQRDAHCLLLDIDMRRRIPVLDDFIRSIFIFLLIIIFLWPFLVLYGLYKLIKSIIEKSCFKCKRPFSMNVTSEKKIESYWDHSKIDGGPDLRFKNNKYNEIINLTLTCKHCQKTSNKTIQKRT